MDIKAAIVLVRDHDAACTTLTHATNAGKGEIGATRELRRVNRQLLKALSGVEPTAGQIEEAISG